MKFDHMHYVFNEQRFVADLTEAMRAMGCRPSDMAREIGAEPAAFSRMKIGKGIPNGRILVAMAAWAGLDLRLYCEERPDVEAERMPRTLYEAHDLIRELRSKLQKQ